MARHDFSDEYNRSVKYYRREFERSQKRIENERYDSNSSSGNFKRNMRQLTQPVQNLGRDAIMHAKINDSTTNEIRNVKRTGSMITGFATGAALAIASVAVTAIKASDLDDRSRRLINDMQHVESDYAHLEHSINESDRERRATTLRTYNEDVSSRNDYYKASYLDEIEKSHETQRQITAESKQNRQVYDNQIESVKSERTSANESYKERSETLKREYEKTQSGFDTKLSESKKEYDQKIESINKSYDSRITAVKSSPLSESEKSQRISSLNQEREDKKQSATHSYNETTERIKESRSAATSEYNNARTDLKRDHNETLKRLSNREEGIKSEYGQKESALKIRAQESTEAVSRAKEKYLSATSAREMPRENDSVRKVKPEAVPIETKFGPFVMKDACMGYVTAQSVENVRSSMSHLNMDLAKRSANELATPEEKKLLDKYENDEKARKNHNPADGAFISKISTEERQQVNAILKTFGGAGFNSTADLKMTLQNSQRAASAIQLEIDKNKKDFSIKHADYEKNAQGLKDMRTQVTNSINAKRALASGQNLSDADKTKLKSQILSKEKEKDLKGKISKGEETLKGKRLELNKLQNTIKRQEITVAGINKQTQLLKRNGKALVTGAMYSDTEKSRKYKVIAEEKKEKAKTLAAKRDKAKMQGNFKKANKLQLKVAQNNHLANVYSKKRLAAMKKGGGKGSALSKKFSKKANMKWKNSTRALQKRIEMKTLTGNSLHKEFKQLKRYTKNAAQYYTMGVNGAIIVTKVAAKMIFAPLTLSNFIGKRLNAKQARIIGKSKNGIKLTKGEAIWSKNKLLNTKLLGGSMKLNKKINKFTNSRGFKHVTKAGRGILMAPATVLNLPNKIMNLPQTMMMGAAKGTVKIAGKTVTLAAKPLGKGVRVGGRALGRGAKFIHRKTAGKAINKFKNSKFAKSAKKNAKKLAATLAKPFKKAAQKAKNFINKKAFKIIRKLFGMLFSIIQSIVSYVLMFIVYALLFVVLLMIMLLIIIVVIALIFSVIAMLLDWLYKQTAQADTEIKNNPGFIPHMAANYRAEELRIFSYFVNNAKHNHDNGTTALEVSTNPLWFEVYNTGLNGTGEIVAKNVKAEDFLKSIKSKHDINKLKDGSKETSSLILKSSKWAGNNHQTSVFFKTLDLNLPFNANRDLSVTADVAKYSDLWVAYLPADSTTTNPKNGKLKENDIAEYVLTDKFKGKNNYEISNAKDALACADSIFQAKQEDCQTYEILAYLGVGATQPTDRADDATTAYDTLFWKSHNILYLTGTKPSDIYYHTLSQNAPDEKDNSDYATDYNGNKHYGKDLTYKIQLGEVYNNKKNPVTNNQSVVCADDINKCNNIELRTFEFLRAKKVTIYKPKHTHNNNSLWTKQANGDLYWYEDLGGLNIKSNSSNQYNYNYNAACHLKVFMSNVCGKTITVPNYTSAISNPDTIYIDKCPFETLYVVSTSDGKYLIAAKITFNGKSNFYQVVNSDDAVNILKPMTNDNKLSTKVNGNHDIEVGIPTFLVLERNRDQEDAGSSVRAYSPRIYWRSTDSTPDPKVGIKLNWYGASWDSSAYRSSGSNMSNLCQPLVNNKLHTGHYKKSSETLNIKYRETFQLCHGHMKLRTVVVVTTSDSPYSIFDKAAELPARSEDFEFHIYSSDKVAGVSGWGGTNRKAFDPSKDFGEHGSARGLARAKCKEKNFYYDWDDDFDDKVSDYVLWGVNDTKVQSIMEGPGGKVCWAMYNFQGQLYYTPSLKSGQQYNIEVYQSTASGWQHKYLTLETTGGTAKYRPTNKKIDP